MLKTLLDHGLTKFNEFFLKISKESELGIPRSSLFHSKKELCLTLNGVMLSEFLVVCILQLLRIKLNKYGGNLFELIL